VVAVQFWEVNTLNLLLSLRLDVFVFSVAEKCSVFWAGAAVNCIHLKYSVIKHTEIVFFFYIQI